MRCSRGIVCISIDRRDAISTWMLTETRIAFGQVPRDYRTRMEPLNLMKPSTMCSAKATHLDFVKVLPL